MLRNTLVTTFTTALLLVVLTACADGDQSNPVTSKTPDTSKAIATDQKLAASTPADNKPKRPKRPEPKAAKPQVMEAFQSAAVMSKPVDFSSPESITNSIQAIQEEAGDDASSRIETAINYMLVYDLSVGRNKQKLYEKLNGKTPNQILAMTNR